MTLSTEQLLRTADTLEKALPEIAFLPDHTRTHEQDIFFDLYRNAAIKSFELSLEAAGKLLRKALQSSSLPMLIDVHLWSTLPKNFHRNIEKAYVII